MWIVSLIKRIYSGSKYYQEHRERMEIDAIGEQKQNMILEILQLACYNSEIDQIIGEVKITKYLEKYGKQQRLKQRKQEWQKQKEKKQKEEKKRRQEEKNRRKKRRKKTKKKKKNGDEEDCRKIGDLV